MKLLHFSVQSALWKCHFPLWSTYTMKIVFFFSINTVTFLLGQHTMKLNESLFKLNNLNYKNCSFWSLLSYSLRSPCFNTFHIDLLYYLTWQRRLLWKLWTDFTWKTKVQVKLYMKYHEHQHPKLHVDVECCLNQPHLSITRIA